MTKEQFFNEIKRYNNNYDLEKIEKAYDKAEELHDGQSRKSGEPYIIHPQNVAIILAKLGMDEDSIIAGLLHDVVEDTDYSLDELKEEFGEEISILVDGVTKLGKLELSPTDKEKPEYEQAENFRKMFLAMSKDIRVLIIKLADRLHNMRTIEYMPPDRRKYKCQETLDIYAPLAGRLGMYSLKFELEEIAFKYLYPEDYEKLVKEVESKKSRREELIKDATAKIEKRLKELGIEYEIYGRSKQLYSIFKKMNYQKLDLSQIFDLTAIRILVDSVRDCYAVLGVIHNMWKPIPGKFKDYIAMPKANMYQSLHTTVMSENGEPFEVQVRTYEMHQVAEYGIAAHWKYKEGKKSKDTTQDEMKLSWLRQALELQETVKDSKEFMDNLKMDLFTGQVFVFTPNGDLIELPKDASPLDFAFKIHSDIGYKCIGAKVNGKIVTIDHKLKNGDIIEILTSPNSNGPTMDWLKMVKSSSSRTKIKQWIKRKEKAEKKESAPEKNKKPETLSNENKQEKKKPFSQHKNINTTYNPDIKVKGADNLLIRTARCCSPLPGDDVIGFITVGRGVTVHRKDCSNITSLTDEGKSRLIEVEWENNDKPTRYIANVVVEAIDRKGLISDISKVCDDLAVDLYGVNAKVENDGSAVIDLTLSIDDATHAKNVLSRIRSLENVTKVYRL